MRTAVASSVWSDPASKRWTFAMRLSTQALGFRKCSIKRAEPNSSPVMSMASVMPSVYSSNWVSGSSLTVCSGYEEAPRPSGRPVSKSRNEQCINHGHKFSRREILRKDAVDLFERLCGGWMERRDGAQKGPSGGHQKGSGHALSGAISSE